MAAHQAPPSLGFSRQEHWSGLLPFPSPMHESEKWKWSPVQLLATPWTAAYQAPPSMGFSSKSTGVDCHCLLHFKYYQYSNTSCFIFQSIFARICANLLLLCLTLCNPMDCSWQGSSVHGILQARILKWIAMSSSRGSSRPRDPTCVSYVLCVGRWVLYN